jgi:hypothetical protein
MKADQEGTYLKGDDIIYAATNVTPIIQTHNILTSWYTVQRQYLVDIILRKQVLLFYKPVLTA